MLAQSQPCLKHRRGFKGGSGAPFYLENVKNTTLRLENLDIWNENAIFASKIEMIT